MTKMKKVKLYNPDGTLCSEAEKLMNFDESSNMTLSEWKGALNQFKSRLSAEDVEEFLRLKRVASSKRYRAKQSKESHNRIREIADIDQICYYGCDQPAKFYITSSSRPCCSTSYNTCPAMRAKNSEGGKKAIKEGRRKSYTEVYQSLPEETKDRIAWSRGLTQETDERVKKKTLTRKTRYKEGKYNFALQGVAADDSLRWKRTQHKTVDSYGNEAILESKNEILFAELCNNHSIKWRRAERFKLKSGKCYTPDFYLPDLNVYTDPKSHFWMKHFNTAQHEKIKHCEEEYSIKVVIFWDTEIKQWENILLELIRQNTQKV